MDEIWDVEVGYVTNRRGARLHLVVEGGRSHCKSGSGVIIRSRKANGHDAPHVCEKCRAALRARVVDVRSARFRRATPGYDLYGVPGNLAIMNGCDALIEGMMTPAERVARAALIDKIRKNAAVSYEAAIAPRSNRPITTPSESDDQLTLF